MKTGGSERKTALGGLRRMVPLAACCFLIPRVGGVQVRLAALRQREVEQRHLLTLITALMLTASLFNAITRSHLHLFSPLSTFSILAS